MPKTIENIIAAIVATGFLAFLHIAMNWIATTEHPKAGIFLLTLAIFVLIFSLIAVERNNGDN